MMRRRRRIFQLKIPALIRPQENQLWRDEKRPLFVRTFFGAGQTDQIRPLSFPQCVAGPVGSLSGSEAPDTSEIIGSPSLYTASVVLDDRPKVSDANIDSVTDHLSFPPSIPRSMSMAGPSFFLRPPLPPECKRRTFRYPSTFF